MSISRGANQPSDFTAWLSSLGLRFGGADNTEFQFQTGNLNFSSTSYQWLVVAGAKAQFKGWGTINGSGNYNFMLIAIDGKSNGGGGVDKFRIKISGGTGGGLVYDNQMNAADTANPTTAIQGGSIVIH